MDERIKREIKATLEAWETTFEAPDEQQTEILAEHISRRYGVGASEVKQAIEEMRDE